MNKKWFVSMVALVLSLALLAACGGAAGAPAGGDEGGVTTPVADAPVAAAPATDAPAAPDPVATGEDIEITIVNNKVEIDGALRNFAALYEERFGVRVNVHSFGGETPYAPALTAMLSAGDEPEIFVFEGAAGYEEARDAGRLTDLSNEPWVADTSMAFFDGQGRVVGFPVAIEGWGLGYNAEILRRAGVDSSTMTNIDGMRAAFETINDQLDYLGLDAVVSMAAAPGMTWVTGLHGFNAYLALGLDYEDRSVIDALLDGQVDETRLRYFAEYYNLLFQHSDRATLLTGGYDQQLGIFAVQRTAFIHQGNWVDPTFAELGVDFEMGYVPHAFLPEHTPGIFVGAPSWYLVNARSANVQAAKDFLNFMASSPEGHRHMVTYSGAVPAFYSVTLTPDGPLSQALNQWAARGQVYPWFQNDMPSGFGMNILGPIFELMAAGDIDPEEFVRLVTDAVANIP